MCDFVVVLVFPLAGGGGGAFCAEGIGFGLAIPDFDD